MKLKYEEIKERVDQVEREKSRFVTMADEMEKLFKLDIYKQSAEERLADKGEEQVLLPQPHNTIRLGQRLLADRPKIDVPALDGEMGTDSRGEKIERWLLAVHDRMNQIQDRPVVGHATWQSMTLGRGCYMVQWVEDVLPKHVRSAQLPFTWKTPDPRNVGLYANSLYTEYGYRKYVEPLGAVVNRYPHLRRKFAEDVTDFAQSTRLVTMIDFYYRSNKDGKIWHTICADEYFAKNPTDTDYPDIPIIQFMGDDTPMGAEEFRGLSLLYPIKDLWKYNVRMMNTLATHLLTYGTPIVTFEGSPQPKNLEIVPGVMIPLANGQKINTVEVNVNQQLVSQVNEIVRTQLDQSTFPGVLYGDAPGSMQAGYGVNILADQARGRIANFKRNHEIALQKLHALTLAMVEEFADEGGVAAYGMESASGKTYRVTLKPSDIKGNYENLVSLQPRIPQDDQQREATGLQKVNANIISRKTFRDKVNGDPLPPDEDERISVEMAMQNPQVMNRMSAQALIKAYPDDWMLYIGGTELEQGLNLKQMEKLNKARAEGKIAPPPPPPAPPQGAPMPPQGGMMPPDGGMAPSAPPAPPQGDPVQMVAEALQGMLQQGMPPEQAAQTLIQQGAPEAVVMQVLQQMMGQQGQQQDPIQQILQMAMQMLQEGMPPEQVMAALGGQGVPPEVIEQVMAQLMGNGDMQLPPVAPGVIPPQMSGQITPQQLGMSNEMYQQVVRGASPDELDARLGLPRR